MTWGCLDVEKIGGENCPSYKFELCLLLLNFLLFPTLYLGTALFSPHPTRVLMEWLDYLFELFFFYVNEVIQR